jgi:signal transduction histidine kinase
VKDMAMDIIKIMSGHTKIKDLEVILNVRSSLTVRSDRKRIEQVLMNLLSNAILCSPHRGKIKVSFSMERYNLE